MCVVGPEGGLGGLWQMMAGEGDRRCGAGSLEQNEANEARWRMKGARGETQGRRLKVGGALPMRNLRWTKRRLGLRDLCQCVGTDHMGHS